MWGRSYIEMRVSEELIAVFGCAYFSKRQLARESRTNAS
jgi:hypothetical protein